MNTRLYASVLIALTLFSGVYGLFAETSDASDRQRKVLFATLEFALGLEASELANQDIIDHERALNDIQKKNADAVKEQAYLRKTIAEESLKRDDRVAMIRKIEEQEDLAKKARQDLNSSVALTGRVIASASFKAKKISGTLAQLASFLSAKEKEWTWEDAELELRKRAELPEKGLKTTAERIAAMKEHLADAALDPKKAGKSFSLLKRRIEFDAKQTAQMDLINARLSRKRSNVSREHPASVSYLLERNLQTQQVVGFLDRGRAWRIRCKICEAELREYIEMLESKASFVRKHRKLFPSEVSTTTNDYDDAKKLLKWIQKYDSVTFPPAEIETLF